MTCTAGTLAADQTIRHDSVVFFNTDEHDRSTEQAVVTGLEQGSMPYLEHFLLAGLGNSPLPLQLSLCLMPQVSNLLRAEHASWLPHAL